MEEDGPRIASEESEELIGLKLDNDGNAFVVLFGTASCASGPVMIEASLENAPYTTHTTMFEVEPPIPKTNEAPTTGRQGDRTKLGAQPARISTGGPRDDLPGPCLGCGSGPGQADPRTGGRSARKSGSPARRAGPSRLRVVA